MRPFVCPVCRALLSFADLELSGDDGIDDADAWHGRYGRLANGDGRPGRGAEPAAALT